MCLAKQRDVDMVLLAGDLFHDNKPSRKSMYQVMRSLRMNCYGEKPCELEMLSDASETFAGAFNHVNYEDPDINVAIPVFSIHGNHDDPSGQDYLAALDILQMSGLINYYGRTPESDNILIKPVLLQKGNTKLALYGMSNVRDERLFRTFRDGNVKFFQPGTQKDDWFNLMSVHQNHHAYTETGYLPEHFLPDFLDLVVWGHEHECLIEPRTNPETNFRVMQPGSSVATSLVKGEAEPKQVAIVSVRGKDFDCESIRLKTVRPFVMKEVTLADDRNMRELAQQHENKPKLIKYLSDIVEELIAEANESWLAVQRESGEGLDEDSEPPLPLVRLRVEYTPPEGGNYEIENPQRFSNRFVGKVANTSDVVQYHRKRQAATRASKNLPDMPEEAAMAQLTIDSIKVERLVKEFLTAQSLTILPQNTFSDAVGLFVDKADKEAMEDFVKESLNMQVQQLIASGEGDDVDEDLIAERMDEIKANMEQKFAKGEWKISRRKGSRKPKPVEWDSDMDGSWEDNPASIIRSDDEMQDGEEDEEESVVLRKKAPAHERGSRGGRGGKAAAGTTRKTAVAPKKTPAKGGRGKKKQVSDDENEEEDDNVVMIDDDDDDDDDEEEELFVRPTKKAPARASKATSKVPPKPTARGTKAATASAAPKQSQINFGQANGTSSRAGTNGRGAAPKCLQEPSEDEISDDDAFEPPPTATSGTRATGRR